MVPTTIRKDRCWGTHAFSDVRCCIANDFKGSIFRSVSGVMVLTDAQQSQQIQELTAVGFVKNERVGKAKWRTMHPWGEPPCGGRSQWD